MAVTKFGWTELLLSTIVVVALLGGMQVGTIIGIGPNLGILVGSIVGGLVAMGTNWFFAGMSQANIEVVARGLTLGEAPHWVSSRQELLYVDLLGQTLRRHVPATGENFSVSIDKNPSIIIPIEGQDNKYIVTMDSSVNCVTWDGHSKKLSSVDTLDTIPQEDGFKIVANDGKCDSQGRLWLGSFGQPVPGGVADMAPNKGYLFSMGLKGHSLKTHVDSLTLANGLAWSSDSTKFYHIDSTTFSVFVSDFDLQEGTLSNRTCFYNFMKNDTKGLPDGMTIDSQNNIWVAAYNGAKILHIDTTTGTLIDAIDFSGLTSRLTSVAFGGPHLDTLYVTSTSLHFPELVPENRVAFTEETENGSLFKVTNLGVKGVMAENYKGSF